MAAPYSNVSSPRTAEQPCRRAGVVRWVGGCTWAYGALVTGMWALLSSGADRWWPATLIAYGPRWIWALPLVILLPTAARLHRPLLWPLLASWAVVVGPVMGLCLSWQALAPAGRPFAGVRILTCNTEGGSADNAALVALIAETRPDVVALQEWSHTGDRELFGDGWHVRGPNQLCLASRFPITDATTFASEERYGTECVLRCDLETPGGPLYFFNVHLASVREGLQEVVSSRWRGLPELRENTVGRRRESEAARAWVDQVEGPVLLAGDFNMPAESAIYRHCWSSWADGFSSAGLGWGHTKFTRWHGIRIDHVLAGPGWRFRRCWVGPDVRSDHRPVLAEVEWVGGLE